MSTQVTDGDDGGKDLASILVSGPREFKMTDKLNTAIKNGDITIKDILHLTKEQFVKELKQYDIYPIQANRAADAFEQAYPDWKYLSGT